MTTFHHARVRIERMVDAAWHRTHIGWPADGAFHLPEVGSRNFHDVAHRASECALPMASALMVAGCIGSTDMSSETGCPDGGGGTSGGWQPQAPVANVAAAHEADPGGAPEATPTDVHAVEPEPQPSGDDLDIYTGMGDALLHALDRYPAEAPAADGGVGDERYDLSFGDQTPRPSAGGGCDLGGCLTPSGPGFAPTPSP